MTDPVIVPLGESLEFRVLDIDRIELHPDNPNVEDLAVFSALVDGMRRDGFTEPVLVVPHGENRWQVIAGEHRLKAATEAGITRIPAESGPAGADEHRARAARSRALLEALREAEGADAVAGPPQGDGA